MIFNYDWWFHGAYQDRVNEAKRRCAQAHFPDLAPDKQDKDTKFKKFNKELEARTIIYLRDGFSYEIKDIVQNPATATMTFECMAADEAYKVGSFVVTVPFDDIVRVEVFAVHPHEKPEDMPSIKGFASSSAQQQQQQGKRPDDRMGRADAGD